MSRHVPLSQYVCSDCSSILKETGETIDISSLVEMCPECGANLADALKKRTRIRPETALPKLPTAYDLTKFKAGIAKIDSLFHIGVTGSYCISGHLATNVLTRICIRAVMPANYGGLGSPYLLVADAGNKSDFYQCSNFAKQYGMDIKSTLDRIIVSRAFTIHQLENLVSRQLLKAVTRYNARAIAIPGLLDLFEDPNIKEKEARDTIKDILDSIRELARKVLVITTVSESKYSDLVENSLHTRIILKERTHDISLELVDGMNRQSITVRERELSLVPKV